MFQPQVFLENRHQDVNRDRNPDLGLDGILRGSIKRFDAKMLLNPFEEQFHLPTRPVQIGNRQSGQRELIGQKGEPLGFLGIEIANAANGVRIVLHGIKTG